MGTPLTERGWGCTLCRLEDPPRTGVGVGMVGLATACLEHLVDAWRDEQLCIRCRSWLAEVGSLCGACAEEISRNSSTENT